MQIGIAGVGRMGANMALRLMEVGHTVTVWNRSADKLKPLADAGAKVAQTPAELASAVETIITILTNADAIDTVYHGPDGLLAGDVKGKLFIEMSTVPPDTDVKLAEKVRAKGASLVECPVGGSTAPARQGKLLGLMGADPADAARAKPILDQLCRRVQHAGPVGSGAILKFAVNLPLMIYWQALGEALAICKPLNLNPDELLDMLSDTSGAANVLKIRANMVVAALKGVDPGPVTFNLDGGIKDVTAMLTEAKRQNIELPVLAKTLECLKEARGRVSGDDEMCTVSAYWPNRQGGGR
jgi:3-hydroxyisobutyrate dehydrogenase